MNPYLLVDIKQMYFPTAPIFSSLLYNTISKLSHKSKVICALEASKMVLQIWEEYTLNIQILTKKQKESPRKAIETIEKWLDGKATKDEVDEHAPVISTIHQKYMDLMRGLPDYTSDIVFATCSTLNSISKAALVVSENQAPSHITVGAVDHAATAAVFAKNEPPISSSCDIFDLKSKFFNKWWNRCYLLIQQEFQEKYDILCNKIIKNV